MIRSPWPCAWIGALLCAALWFGGAERAMAGQLRIRSTPSGAELYVNGSKRGQTPFSGTLTSGRYHIELRRDGFLTWTSYIELPQRSEVSIRALLERNTGGTAATSDDSSPAGAAPSDGKSGGLLIVNTRPSGAAVYLGSTFLGRSPLLKFIPIGTHTISMQLNGFQDVTREIRVRTSKSVRIKLKMTPGTSSKRFRMRKRKAPDGDTAAGGGSTLLITSRPTAKVYLNNKYLGRTPLLSAGFQAGTYQLMLKRAGFLPYRRSLQLIAGEQTRIKASLVRRR